MFQVTKRTLIDASTVKAICRIIGDSNDGLTGTEIVNFLNQSKTTDVSPGITKWQRLFNAFAEWQNTNICSNHILTFIELSVSPVKYVGKNKLFQLRLNEVNKQLSFPGVELNQTGKYVVTQKANTISETEQRANHFSI